MMRALDGKAIVITGASRGLGESVAVCYAREGAHLVLAARSTDDLDRVAAACTAAGAPGAAVVPTDVTVEGQVQRLVAEAMAEHGRIDVFVANAGASYLNMTDKRYAELPTYDIEIVEKLLRLNTIGTWLCMKHALPVMEDSSSFIAVGSGTGRAAYAGSGFYAVSKATIDVMSMIASKEMAEAGVRVNVLSPGGMVDTHLFGPNKMNEHMRNLPHILPLDVMDDAAVWLASDDSAGVTGQLVEGKDYNAQGPDIYRADAAAGADARS